MALKMHPSLAVHVGDWLKTEIVEPAQVSVTALAEHFGVSRQALSTLLNGNANLSADMAIRFEKAFGIKADTLLRMQTTYDLAQARVHEQDIKVQKFSRAACADIAAVPAPGSAGRNLPFIHIDTAASDRRGLGLCCRCQLSAAMAGFGERGSSLVWVTSPLIERA